tara:strand:- start:869 stop:1108 length:240 start_codon:yes stop_codon:yes gene_type:complete
MRLNFLPAFLFLIAVESTTLVGADRPNAFWWDYQDSSAQPIFVELFDHENDPGETVNVAAAHPDVVNHLTAELNRTLSP